MRRVFFNQKGGVGKSSITCNLAAVAADVGQRTLVVDLDVQGNSTRYLLGERASSVQHTIADFFEQSLGFNLFNRPVEDYVHATRFPGLYVLPSSPELDFLERKLEAKHKIYKLRELLKNLGENFDQIMIDTAPALNFFTRSALIAAERCVIPFDCDDFSRQALYNLMGEIQELQSDHNPDLKIEGVLVNQFQARARLPIEMIKELVEEGLPVLPVHLASSIKMRESHQAHAPLVHYAPTHALTNQFRALYACLSGERVLNEA